MLMKYSSLKYSEFILAFQLQFGTYEAERRKTLDNWLHFYLSEPRVLAEAAGCKSTDTDFTEQAFSHVEKHAYEVFIVEI